MASELTQIRLLIERRLQIAHSIMARNRKNGGKPFASKKASVGMNGSSQPAKKRMVSDSFIRQILDKANGFKRFAQTKLAIELHGYR